MAFWAALPTRCWADNSRVAADLIGAFQRNGLGDVVGSWVDTGSNQPISADQPGSVLGSSRPTTPTVAVIVLLAVFTTAT